MPRKGTPVCFMSGLLFISGLTGCYGTKAPPPEPSPSAPPGLSQAIPDDFTVPDALPELLAAYRQWLIEKNGHISPTIAQQYANAEIARITEQYAGSEAALKSAIKRRFQVRTPKPTLTLGTQPTTAYPTDMTMGD